MAQAETVENYNRRDNIRLHGVEENARQNDEVIFVGEKDSETIENVIDVASSMGVTLDERDISTAHRPPGGKTVERRLLCVLHDGPRRQKCCRTRRNGPRTSGNLMTYHQQVSNSSL